MFAAHFHPKGKDYALLRRRMLGVGCSPPDFDPKSKDYALFRRRIVRRLISTALPANAIAEAGNPTQFIRALETTPAPLLFDSAFLAKLEQLFLLSKKLFRGAHRAERRSRQIGSSLEFADYRNYTLGDDLRSIDWNIYGRL